MPDTGGYRRRECVLLGKVCHIRLGVFSGEVQVGGTGSWNV